MFEEFRADAGEYGFDEVQEGGPEQDVYALRETAAPQKQPILGMTPPQRFLIAVMVLLMTCLLSSFLLLVAERIAPPFMS